MTRHVHVTPSLLQTTFRTDNKMSEYIIDFSDIFPDVKLDVGMGQHVVVHNAHKSGCERYNDIGWFATQLLDGPVNPQISVSNVGIFESLILSANNQVFSMEQILNNSIGWMLM